MTGTPRLRRAGRALVELLAVTCVVIVPAGVLGVLLNALVSMADARVKAGPNVVSAHHRLRTPGGPLDGGIVSAPAAAGYSFRLLRQAYAGKAVQLRRASDSAVLDIGFGAGGGFDTPAATTFCAATTCTVEVWYDQSGNARNATRMGVLGPALVFACLGANPCARFTSAVEYMESSSVTWAAGRTSLSAVGNRSIGTGTCNFILKSSNDIGARAAAANTWEVSDNVTNTFLLTAADAAWHAGVGVIDAAASVGRIDGTETAGANTTGAATAGVVRLTVGTAGTTCRQTETIIWDNYALTLAERANLTANQRTYWGF